ncbi:MAG: class I SAM-dependent methyltransferase [Chloroflexota bacterium]
MPSVAPEENRELSAVELAAYYDNYWSGSDPAALAAHSYRAFQADLHAHVARLLGPLAGLRTLEIGPGLGHTTLWLAQRGAEVTAIDISRSSLGKVGERLSAAGQAAHLVQSPGENLPLADGSFDLAFVECVLMHTDWRRTVAECARVLRPGGRALFIEPLRHHPLVALYRATVSSFKATQPHFLSWWDFDEIGRHFQGGERRAFYFFSPGTLPLRGTPIDRWLRAPLQAFDRALLDHLPPLRPFAWYLAACYQR